jgi:hypothetical protein
MPLEKAGLIDEVLDDEVMLTIGGQPREKPPVSLMYLPSFQPSAQEAAPKPSPQPLPPDNCRLELVGHDRFTV